MTESLVHGFWAWFVQNEEALFGFEGDRERLSALLAGQLRKLHEDLAVAIGPVRNGKRELIFTARGVSDAFPIIFALADKAPWLPRWVIRTFKGPVAPIPDVPLPDGVVRAADVEFCLFRHGCGVGIQLFMDGCEGNGKLERLLAAYVMINDGLGEFDAQTKVASVEVLPFTARARGERHPIAELPKRFDELQARGGG